MTFDKFNKLTEELLADVRKMRDTKGKEYTHKGDDRFDNFNRLAATLDMPRQKVWQVYFAKHIDAIYSFIKEQRTFSDETARGRIVDAITYLTLLAGMIEEDSAQLGLPLPSAADLDLVAAEQALSQSNIQGCPATLHLRGEYNILRCVLSNDHEGDHKYS